MTNPMSFLPLMAATAISAIVSFYVRGRKRYFASIYIFLALWLIVFILTFYVKAFGQ